MNKMRQGFSLLETIVAISLALTALYLVNSLVFNSVRSTKSTQIRLDLQDIRRKISSSLSCPVTFAAYGAARPIPCSGPVILKDKDGATLVPTSGKLAGWDIDARCEVLGGQNGVSIYATKKLPSGGFQPDPVRKNVLLNESHPMSLIFKEGVRPCSSYFGAPSTTTCPFGEYMSGANFDDKQLNCVPLPACTASQAISWNGAAFYCVNKTPPVPSCSPSEELAFSGGNFICRKNMAAACKGQGGSSAPNGSVWLPAICLLAGDLSCGKVPGCIRETATMPNVSWCSWTCKLN